MCTTRKERYGRCIGMGRKGLMNGGGLGELGGGSRRNGRRKRIISPQKNEVIVGRRRKKR